VREGERFGKEEGREANVFDLGWRKAPIWLPRGDVTKSMSIVCSWKRKAYTSL